MKVNVYAEEMKGLEDGPTVKKKVSNGVEYIGLHFGVAEHDGVTLWFESRSQMIDAMYKAVNSAINVSNT